MKKLLKVAAFVTFPISVMVLFEIEQRFKGHFLNELCVSFKIFTFSSDKWDIKYTVQKMKFSITNFSVNVTKSEGNCRFGQIY